MDHGNNDNGSMHAVSTSRRLLPFYSSSLLQPTRLRRRIAMSIDCEMFGWIAVLTMIAVLGTSAWRIGRKSKSKKDRNLW